jgi:hypothetical protein
MHVFSTAYSIASDLISYQLYRHSFITRRLIVTCCPLIQIALGMILVYLRADEHLGRTAGDMIGYYAANSMLGMNYGQSC